MYGVRVFLKAGQVIEFDAKSVTVTFEDEDPQKIKAFEWEDARPALLYIHVDNIAAVLTWKRPEEAGGAVVEDVDRTQGGNARRDNPPPPIGYEWLPTVWPISYVESEHRRGIPRPFGVDHLPIHREQRGATLWPRPAPPRNGYGES